MSSKLALLLLAALLAAPALAAAEHVRIETSQGVIVAELLPDESPKTVANFLAYVDAGFFDGTVFHRVIPGFMIQGGGFTADLEKKDTRPPVENESANGLKNTRGTLAMARTNDPDSATAQFFINSVDNPTLDHGGPYGGYAVFGRVVSGMDVVDAISKVRTGRQGGMANVPLEPVTIESITRTEAPAPAADEATPAEG